MPWTLSPHPPLSVNFQWRAEQASLDFACVCPPLPCPLLMKNPHPQRPPLGKQGSPFLDSKAELKSRPGQETVHLHEGGQTRMPSTVSPETKCTGYSYVNLTHGGVREEEASTEKIPPLDLAVGKPVVGHFLN